MEKIDGMENDAEHPTIIPMYTQTNAFGPKVNSLLSKSSLPYVRHGCYFKRGPCAYSGTPEESKESPRTKAKRAWERRKEKEEESAATAAGHPAMARTSGPSRAAGHPARVPEIRTPPNPRATRPTPPARTSGPLPGHPAFPACVQCIWAKAHVPLRPLDYIYSPSG